MQDAIKVKYTLLFVSINKTILCSELCACFHSDCQRLIDRLIDRSASLDSES